MDIKKILTDTKTIAVIGIKDKPREDAYDIPLFMKEKGYKICPVNATKVGKEILGEICVEKVTDLNQQVDMVNIFRKSEFLIRHAEEILQMNPLPKYVWFQLGIENNEAAKMLEERGIEVIQDSCLSVEHRRYMR